MWGSDAEYVPPPALSPQVECTIRFERAQEAASRVDEEIGRLRQSPNYSNKTSPNFQKFEYLAAEIAIYNAFLESYALHDQDKKA